MRFDFATVNLDWLDVHPGGAAGFRRRRAHLVLASQSRRRAAARHLRSHSVRRHHILRTARRPQSKRAVLLQIAQTCLRWLLLLLRDRSAPR